MTDRFLPKNTAENINILDLWSLIILIELNVYGESLFLDVNRFVQKIGLGHLIEANKTDDDDLILIGLSKALEREKDIKHDIPSILKENIKHLNKIIKLSKVEKKILSLLICINTDQHLMRHIIKMEDQYAYINIIHIIAQILRLPIKKVTRALSINGVLLRSGLISMNRENYCLFKDRFTIMNGFSENMIYSHCKIDTLFSQYIKAIKPSVLNKKNFSYLKEEISIISKLLINANKRHEKGISILLHGAPGTGKTQLTSVLMEMIDFNGYEIPSKNTFGEPIEGQERINTFCLAQSVLKNKKQKCIVFDEVEQVFEGNDTPGESSKISKAWVNELLETMPVPSIFISNRIEHIDEAYLRRFSLIIPINIPPKAVRNKIINTIFDNVIVSEKWKESVASNEQITPAIISQAKKVLTLIQSDSHKDSSSNKLQNEKTLTLILNNNLAGMTKKKITSILSHKESYNLDLLNTDTNIKQLVAGIKKHHQARILSYGPPGVGKTALAHYLSEITKCPLIEKKASDLLSKYIGETETNINNMFQEAREEQAILVLDEADSFISQRSSSKKSWEISQTNELLVGMEQFNGLFLCSTNLVHNLDQASSRRFDIKIKFDFMTTGQVILMFKNTLMQHGWKKSMHTHIQHKLHTLRNLTPGDFKTVVRKVIISGYKFTPETLFNELLKESEFKAPKKSKGIGFMASFT